MANTYVIKMEPTEVNWSVVVDEGFKPRLISYSLTQSGDYSLQGDRILESYSMSSLRYPILYFIGLLVVQCVVSTSFVCAFAA